MGFLKEGFGGGKNKTNWKALERQMQMENEMNMRDKFGLFSNQVWKKGEDGRYGMHHEVNPGMQGGMDRLMERFGSGNPYEGYSGPSGMQELLDSRMKHQFERMNMQAPQPQLGQAGGMPGSMGPSPAGPPGPPPAAQMPGPMPPGAGPGPMPPGQGGPMPPGAQNPQLGQAGGMPGSMGPSPQGPGPQGPPQGPGMAAMMGGSQAPPQWAQNQRFQGGLMGGGEAMIDTIARNRALGEGEEKESVMKNMFSALMGR